MKSLASADVLSETRGRLRCLTVDDRALWGRMTAAQMVRHLSCAYEIALGEREVAPLKLLSPALMKWGGLRSGLRWPKNLATTPELELALKEEATATFEELVELAIAKMEAVASSVRLAPRHPMFGPMSGADWMRWGYLHADHHLRQFGR
jgi:Protein of unknown function (DUF1569)